MYTPIYELSSDGKTVNYTGFVKDAAGNQIQMPVSSLAAQFGTQVRQLRPSFPAQYAAAMGVQVNKTAAKNAAIPTQQTEFNKMMNPNNPALTLAEKTNGQITAVRLDTPQGGTGTGQTLKIVFENAAGVGTVQAVLGAPAGVLQNKLSIPAIPPGFNIDGDYGTATLTSYNSRIQSGEQIKLKGMVTFKAYRKNLVTGVYEAAPDLYGGNLMNLGAILDPKGTQVQNAPFDFDKGYTGQQYDLSVRQYNDFSFFLASVSGLIFSIPQDCKLVVSFEIGSMANAYAMQKF